MFEFLDYSQFLEICTASKEIMLFHDNGFALLRNHPMTALLTMLWFAEKINVYPRWLLILLDLSNIMLGCSLHALLVMSFDVYLATYYPMFHRTSMTKGKLLTLFAFAVMIKITVAKMSINNLVISYQVGLLIICIIFIPPMLFIN